jgi:hypothetical protein
MDDSPLESEARLTQPDPFPALAPWRCVPVSRTESPTHLLGGPLPE